MITRVAEERVRFLNNEKIRTGRYVLYWMQSSHRTVDNPALQYAVERADHSNAPVIVYFGLSETYPEANLRHFNFMLEGLEEVSKSFEEMNIKFILKVESPDEGALNLSRDASVVVVDRGYLKHQIGLYNLVAERCRCPFIQVEGNVVVPVETASPKEEYSAGTFRPKITRLLDRFLHPVENISPKLSSLHFDFPSLVGEPIQSILSGLNIDKSVPVSSLFKGGTNEAKLIFTEFMQERLDSFSEGRNDPGGIGSSNMSPYLHFGQVSPVSLAIQSQEHGGKGTSVFLEELIVRRELAVNFVRYNNQYDNFQGLPKWSQNTLNSHTDDKREYVYSLDELENASTHDQYWNASQLEMKKTGKMQGYMRMYWGKKILEWTEDPREAYTNAVFLNNKYEIDGRDPGGYAGIAWCFGKHDRPWKEREIFGMVRYMNFQGLKRKFSMDNYVQKIRRFY